VIFVVDDDASVREALDAMIRREGWQVETFTAAPTFLARPRVFAPSCLILDVSQPGLDGLDVQDALAHDRIDMPIIFITRFGDVPTTVRAMKAGAAEFLTKPFDNEVMLAAIRLAIEHSRATLENELDILALEQRCASLSRREREVMALVVMGQLNKQIAAELGISEITVKAHRGQVMRKMMAGSLAELVRIDARLQHAHAARATHERIR
jgi:FixJ family two-component response regulator